jgi:putative Ca2+/H+ antiporter (TMEM165/GDT1 family)
MEIFLKIFLAVFIAELGDKTQLATMGFSATEPVSKWVIFLASASALVLASGIGVLAGHWISQLGWEKYLKLSAGVLFIGLGLYMLVENFI